MVMNTPDTPFLMAWLASREGWREQPVGRGRAAAGGLPAPGCQAPVSSVPDGHNHLLWDTRLLMGDRWPAQHAPLPSHLCSGCPGGLPPPRVASSHLRHPCQERRACRGASLCTGVQSSTAPQTPAQGEAGPWLRRHQSLPLQAGVGTAPPW